MSLINSIPIIKKESWESAVEFSKRVRQSLQQLAHLRLGIGSEPTFASLTLNDLTATRLVQTNASKTLISVADLTSWVAGVANEIDITDDGDGTITIGIVNPLIVGKGGTGTDTLTDHSLLVGSGTDPITALTAATNGQLPIGSTGVDPVIAALTGTANQLTVTNGAGSITLSLPQDIHTGATPTFAGLISTGVVRATDFAKTGWPTNPGVTLSFDNASKVFTVTDGGSAYYYIDGVKYTLGGNKTVDLDTYGAAEGLWYIYFVGDTLTASQTIWNFAAEDKALVGYLYWDATNNKEIFLGYELHTFHMDGTTHARLHYAGGARWETGLLVTDTGSETVNVSAGDIWDEDLNITITDDDTPTALFEQILSPAQLPIYYRDGATAWRVYETTDKAAATDIGYLTGGNLQYNKLNGTWANATVSAPNHVAYWVVATNDQTTPIVLIMGQRIDLLIADAKENNIFGNLDLTGLPFEEMVVLARLILKDTGTYTLEEVLDLRAYNIKGNITSPLTSDHGGLAGLGDDDHQQYIKDSEFTQDSGVLVGTAAGTFAEETGATLRTSLGLGTADSPTFANLSLGTGELTCGSINRAADTLTLEIAGTPVVSIAAALTTVASGLLVDQDSDAIALEIDSAATSDTNYALSVTTTAGAMVAAFLNGDGNAGQCYLGLLSNNAYSGTYFFSRNLTAGSTDCPVVYMVQDHADDDRPVLELKQDGTGEALLISEGGRMTITGGITISDALIIPDDGYIGSVSETSAIQISSTGVVTFIGAIDTPSDITCGGHLLFDIDNGHIAGPSSNPRLTFNNAGDQAEVTGNFTISKHLAIAGTSIDADIGVIYGELLTDTDNSIKRGISSVLQVTKTAAAMTAKATGIYSSIVLDSTNTQNWSYALAGLCAIHSHVETEASSAGTVTGAVNLLITSTFADAATVSNYSGIYIETPTVANNKVTTAYGIYIDNIDTAGTNNYAIYTTAGTVRIGGAITAMSAITALSTLAVEGASVTIGKASTTTGTLVLHDSNSANTITLTVPDISAGSLSFTLPPTDGDNTNVLQTDGNGILTWVAAGGSFVDRGDPAAYDYQVGDLTTDGAWHDLDLGPGDKNIVPTGATGVLLRGMIRDDAVGNGINFRKKGNTDNKAASTLRTQAVNATNDSDLIVPCDSDGIIQYLATNTTFTNLNITVLGWWR